MDGVAALDGNTGTVLGGVGSPNFMADGGSRIGGSVLEGSAGGTGSGGIREFGTGRGGSGTGSRSEFGGTGSGANFPPGKVGLYGLMTGISGFGNGEIGFPGPPLPTLGDVGRGTCVSDGVSGGSSDPFFLGLGSPNLPVPGVGMNSGRGTLGAVGRHGSPGALG